MNERDNIPPEKGQFSDGSSLYSDINRDGKKVENPAEDRKKVEKVTIGETRTRKKSLGKRMAETFLGENAKNVGFYILHDVLIPSAKDMLSDMVKGGIDVFLFGERRSSNKSNSNINKVNYSSIYDKSRLPPKREISKIGRARHEFDEIIFDTRKDAESVLFQLSDLTIDYGIATIADLYDLSGITSAYTDNKYGWVDLGEAKIFRAHGGGYIIDLPRPKLLD